MAILKRCGCCGSRFNAHNWQDQYCDSCRGLPKEDDAVIFAMYGMDKPKPAEAAQKSTLRQWSDIILKPDEKLRPPYPWCSGYPTVADCVERGFCLKDPNCGE